MSADADSQLALQVDPSVFLCVREQRDGRERALRVGPVTERAARTLAALLLNRSDEPDGDGPWRCAVAGGLRNVALERDERTATSR